MGTILAIPSVSRNATLKHGNAVLSVVVLEVHAMKMYEELEEYVSAFLISGWR
jgi:hypothetical protein